MIQTLVIGYLLNPEGFGESIQRGEPAPLKNEA
jgi:hypothetical protein